MSCWSFRLTSLLVFSLSFSSTIGQNQSSNDSTSSPIGQNPSIQKVGCQLASLYQHPNASSSLPVPAIDITTAPGPDGELNVTFKESSTTNWTFTNVLGQTADAYAPDNHTVLEQALYLDTSASVTNATSIQEAGLTGCSFFFSLPFSDLGRKDDGQCFSIFDEKCVNDFIQQANKAALKASTNLTDDAMPWGDSCKSIADAMSSLPPSCIKFKEKGSKSLGNGIRAFSPLDLRQPSARSAFNCDESEYPLNNSSVPANLFVQSASWPNLTDYKLYDQWYSTVTPILLTYFANTSMPNIKSQPFSTSRLICSSPYNVQAGSRVVPAPKPSNAADNSMGGSNVMELVLGALVVNAIFFWML